MQASQRLQELMLKCATWFPVHAGTEQAHSLPQHICAVVVHGRWRQQIGVEFL
jgi:hypothetical protein